MKTNSGGFLTIVMALFLLIECRSPGPHWKNQNPAIVDGLLYYWPEPGIEVAAVSRSEHMIQFQQWLSHSLFPDRPTAEVRVVFYRDHRSYSQYRPGTIDSLAHFHRKSGLVHIPVNIQVEGWKHELVHAILHSRFSSYPLWIQEGGALLLQSSDSQRPLCGAQLRLPEGLHTIRNKLLQKRGALPFMRESEFHRNGIYEETALAGYFIFYLWQKGELIHFIRTVAASEQGSFLILLDGDYQRLRQMEDDFYNWMRSPLPLSPHSGC